MKTPFNKSLQLGNTDLALLFIRVSIALLMLTHGLPKLAKFFSDEPIAFASVFGMNQSLSLAFAIFAEVFCSVLILVGLGTRFASIPLIFTMAVAGGGKYSLDAILAKRSVHPAK